MNNIFCLSSSNSNECHINHPKLRVTFYSSPFPWIAPRSYQNFGYTVLTLIFRQFLSANLRESVVTCSDDNKVKAIERIAIMTIVKEMPFQKGGRKKTHPTHMCVKNNSFLNLQIGMKGKLEWFLSGGWFFLVKYSLCCFQHRLSWRLNYWCELPRKQTKVMFLS